MSRCFPFPPPGYEKKIRTDDVDLLKKEKHREKKHKKEKRDKEKRESKEKREKEGRDGKHKEKKYKMEKHRDKKKDKDKDRDKDKVKNSAGDEKGFSGQAEGPTAGKLHQKEIKQKDKDGILFEERITRQYTGNNGDRARDNFHLAEENKDSKFLQELGRRIEDGDGGAGNQFLQKITIADQKKNEGTVRLVAMGRSTWSDGKEKLDDKSIDARNIDSQGNRTEAWPIGNAAVQNHARNFHLRADGMSRPLEKNFDRTVAKTVEGKEKVREKKDDNRGEKRKDKDKEKKGHGKDKDRDKEKKVEKMKEQTEHKNTDQNRLKEAKKGGPVGTNSFTQIPRNSQENAVIGENLKKRKDSEPNGVLHANDNWPSKLPRLSSIHSLTENGRILEPCQISIPHASNELGAATDLKVDNKERKINGIIESQPSAVSTNKTTTATVRADLVAEEASAKPTHPDSKYLSQVVKVPKMEEWCDFDDQEWLFSSSSLQERKCKVESSEVEETLQVWAEALHIEPADICALPYVIPY